MKQTFLFIISALVFVAQTLEVASADREFIPGEVAIYGATPAGIAAALAAAEGNRRVLLIEPTSRIGGMTTHGLSHSDFHSFEAQSGPFLHFSQRVLKHYTETYGKDSEQVRDSWQGTHGEPSVNLLVFETMLAEQPSITVLKNHRLVDATVANDAVMALRFVLPDSREVTVTPRLVVDASYEGDLLEAAGVPYRVGREARSEYGESLAPETADDELQGYNFRLCMTQDPENRVPIPVPENYNREDYAAVVPLVEAGEFPSAFGYPGRRFMLKAHLPILPNGKHDINDVSKSLVRLSLPGRNREYPEGDLATRRRIEQEHLDWQFGLIHFVQTDPALPEAFRKEAATWGLCRDEFADTDHIPPQIYVREARRMVGLRVYTEADTEYAPNDARARLHSDSIAVGEYSHNCHGTGHEGPKIGGKHTGEFYKGVAPYQIPYRVIVPKKLRNLLAPVACSASHVGFCAIRLEPIWMSLGEAAGLAADLVLEGDLAVQQVDVARLQKRIWSRGGATIHLSDVPPDHPDFTAVQWWGNLGGWHGIEPAPKKPGTRGKPIVSQYFEAFPGHAARLDQSLDEALRKRWTAVAKQHGLPVPEAAATRAEWIRSAFTVASGKPFAITDLETRVVARADGRWFGRATVERTAEGTLVLCYRGATKHTGADGVIHVRFSNDGGQNWSKADHAIDGSPIAGFPISFSGDDAFEPYLYVAPNGKIILHVWRTKGPSHREGKGTWQTDSADGGQTWSQLRQVDFVGIDNDDHCYATDDHTTIDGKIYTSLREYVGGEQRWRCRFIQSPDNGASWRVVGEQVNVPEHNSVEKGFEYVGDDRIVSVGSDGPGRRFVLQTRSEDRGKTWRRWTDALPQTGVWDRPRIWTLAHLKGEAEWWTDDTLIGVGNTTPKAGKKFPRANAVYLSTDRGESWQMLGGKPIDEFYPDGGYGDLEYDPVTGWFVYLSYRGKGLHGEAEIVQYRFRLKDRTELADFQHLVHSATWTEKWPDESGEIREHKVTAEIWTKAMQAELDQTGKLHIPAREKPYYLDGPLVLKSGQRLTADPKAEIRLKPGSNTCMVRNANLVGFKDGPVPEETNPDADIHIEGGIWTTLAAAKNELNGNARGHSSRQNWAFGTHGVILFQNARRISVKNITVRKSKPFAIHLGNVHEFEIDGLTLEDHYRDGVHVNGPASRGTIRNIRGNSHDDPVALNAWEWKNYAPSYGPIRDVLVENVAGASTGASAIRLLPGVKRFDDGTELDCPLENITLRRITDIREFKIYDQPNLEMGRDKDFSIGVGSIENLRFEHLVFNRPGKIELHANTDGLVIRDVRINHPITDDWRLLAVGPKSQTWNRAKDPAKWTEIFSPDLDCTVRNVTVSGVRARDSKTDLPIERVVEVIEQKLNPDYPKTTPKGGTGKGIWIR